MHRLVSVIQHSLHQFQELLRTRFEITSGALTGATTGVILVETNYITNLLLAMIFSLFSGAAGALGGLAIKRVNTWYNKRYGKEKKA
jgi:hypothetical protein